MPFTCIPLEVHGHVLQGLSPQDQAQFRGCSHDTVYGYTIAVVNEQFIKAAGSMDAVDSLSGFDVRWFPLNARGLPRALLGSIVVSSWCVTEPNALQDSSSMQHINYRHHCRQLYLLFPKKATSLGHVRIGPMHSAFVERAAFVGLDDAASVALPAGFFKDWCGLKSVVLPASLTTLPEFCFRGCSRLTTVDLPVSLTSLPRSCFSGCSGLTTVDLPASLTSLDESCFHGCSGLTTLDLPASLTSLGKFCFFGCSGLTTVDLPASLTTLGESCFDGCSGR